MTYQVLARKWRPQAFAAVVGQDPVTRTLQNALASGIKDPHIFAHAAMIASAAGRLDEGRDLLQQAGALNPYFTRFHEHR